MGPFHFLSRSIIEPPARPAQGGFQSVTLPEFCALNFVTVAYPLPRKSEEAVRSGFCSSLAKGELGVPLRDGDSDGVSRS